MIILFPNPHIKFREVSNWKYQYSKHKEIRRLLHVFFGLNTLQIPCICNTISAIKNIWFGLKDFSNVNSYVSPRHFALKRTLNKGLDGWHKLKGVNVNEVLFNYANNPLIVSIVNLCTLYETQNTFIFSQTTKYITSCSLKHFRDRWGTNCPARTTMTDPLPHMSLRQKYACVQVKMGGVEMSSCNYLYHKTVSKMIMSVQKTQDVN